KTRLLKSSVFRAAQTGVVLKGLAFGMVLAGLTSGTLAFADPANLPNHAGPPPLTVPKAKCGPHDHPETALQAQGPAPLPAAGFKGFNCNLELIGQVRGDGANWQSDEFRAHHDHGRGDRDRDGKDHENRGDHVCAYHGTAFTTAGRTHVGVPVIDITNPSAP